ncbi:MAG: PEGA domain-containing protein [Panacagrimonas sp.]
MSADADRITPVAYQPASPSSGGDGARRPPLALLLVAVALLVGGLSAWFFITAVSIKLDIHPGPDAVDISGAFALPLGERTLLRPGQVRISANKQGYQPLSEPLKVEDQQDQIFQFELEKLPGLLNVISSPAAALHIDGKPVGTTPVESIELAAGKHQLRLSAERHQVFEADIEIEGKGLTQRFEAELVPAWAEVAFSSEPGGASVSLGEQLLGTTPLTAEIGAGAHDISLSLEGYKPWRGSLSVVADVAQTYPKVKLERADAVVKLSSTPSGASVTVNGTFRGKTPLRLTIKPAVSHRIKVSKAGHKSAERRLRLAPEEAQDLSLRLEPIFGVLQFEIQPRDAELRVNGELQSPGTAQLRLPSAPQKISVSKKGFVSHEATVTPRPGLDQQVKVVLKTPAELKAASVPRQIKTRAGQTLKLMPVGRFTMGSKRGTQGRQANEGQRPVRLSRPYYLSTTEISNAQYRKFDRNYSSGIVGRRTLDNDKQPVVRLSWNKAVEYCNWLSQQDGLPPAYAPGSGKLVDPLNHGYRLPTEAEWAWAARFAGRKTPLRYPWGHAMPPSGRAGNYADLSAATLVSEHLSQYQDGFATTAAVGSFPANPLGLFDLGGNVSEWVHDRYGSALVIGAKEQTDPLGSEQGSEHVIRGSSWMHGRITELRLAWRGHGLEGRPDVGFRIARYVESTP